MGEPLPGAPYNPWSAENQAVEPFRVPAPEQPAFILPGPFSHATVKVAADNHWDLIVKYARGPLQHATQESYKMVHWISARYTRGLTQVAAIWVADVNKDDPKYAFWTAIRNDQIGRLNSKELTALLKTAP